MSNESEDKNDNAASKKDDGGAHERKKDIVDKDRTNEKAAAKRDAVTGSSNQVSKASDWPRDEPDAAQKQQMKNGVTSKNDVDEKKGGSLGTAGSSTAAEREGVNNVARNDDAKPEVAKQKIANNEVASLEDAKPETVKHALKNDVAAEALSKIDVAKKEASNGGDTAGNEGGVAEQDVLQSDGSKVFAEDGDTERVLIGASPGVVRSELPRAHFEVDRYAAIAAAADDYDYESRENVMSSVQSLLIPKGDFLSRAELLEASRQLRKVMPYNFEAWRLHADILLNALRQLETRQIMPDDSFQILTVPLRENDIRDAAEAALRQCAHFAQSEERRIQLVDEANSVRRLTWF